MARGQRHEVKHVCRQATKAVRAGQAMTSADMQVLVIGERADGRYFEAEFPWGDTVDTIESTPGA